MSLDDTIRDRVAEGVAEALGPYLRRLGDPEPLVHTVPAAAKALCTSQDTVRRLIADGHLATVPHMGNRVLIPRWSLEALVDSARPAAAAGPDAPATPSAGVASGPPGASGRTRRRAAAPTLRPVAAGP